MPNKNNNINKLLNIIQLYYIIKFNTQNLQVVTTLKYIFQLIYIFQYIKDGLYKQNTNNYKYNLT